MTAPPLPLSVSDAWLQTVAETASAGIFVYRDRLLYVNPACALLTGYPVDELLRLDPGQLLAPEVRGELMARAAARLRGDLGPQRRELPILRRDGERRWVDVSATVVELADGAAIVGTVIDVTDRKRTEEAQRESESWFRTLAEHTATAIFVYRDRLLYANPAAAELTRYPVEELVGMDPLDLIHPDYREVMRARRDARIEGAPAPRRYEAVALTRGGEERWIDLSAGRITFQGQPAAVATVFDITDRKRAELALRHSEERLHLAQRAAGVVTWDWNLLTDELQLSDSTAEFLGLPPEAMPTTTAEFLERLVYPDDRGRVLAAVRRVIKEGADYHVEHRFLTPEGTIRWFVERGRAIRDESGWVVRMLGVSIDTTERKQAELALHREKEQAQATLASIGDGVIRTDARARVDYMNPVAEKLTGFTLAEVLGRPVGKIYRVVDEASGKRLLNPVERCLKENRPVILPGQRLLLGRDGGEYAIRDSAAPIRGRSGELLGAVLAVKDITAVRDMEREMTYLASHDGMTGLLNRAEFERRLSRALEAVAERPSALLYVDLSQLKVINDTCGHLAGDEALKQVARLLEAGVGEGDSVTRLGGDEFGVLLGNCPLAEARRRAAAIRDAVGEFRFGWLNRTFDLGVSIGLVALSPGDTTTHLMIAGDTACRLARESGRNRIHEYQPDDAAVAERYSELRWIHRIRRALEEESFQLYSQPVQPLLAADRDELICEVLVRMVDEEGELVLPESFIATAERYRMISAIDRWVVKQSFRALAGWASLGGRQVTHLAINLSGESLNDDTFLDFVARELADTGVDAARVLFEITETSAIANLSGAMRLISNLKQRGSRFVLDDFGSGLSSFAYLKNLPIDCLKVDREFVRGVAEPGIQRTLVRSINQIGHDLGLLTIAEGVEDEATLRAIQELRLDYAQGYWISPPQPLEFW